MSADKLHESLKVALAQSAAGEVVRRGSFAHHAVEFTGNIQVHHPDRQRAEDMQAIWSTHAAAINRLQQDSNNPDGDL